MLDYPFNWRWALSTKSRSRRVKPTPVSLSARSFSLRGPNDASKFKSFQLEVQSDVGALASLVNNTVLPVIDSLPAGGADARWGLRQEIDCFTYGVQGSTLFVFNTASESIADGRYWNSDERRPYTIAEKLEDQDGRISWLESNNNTNILSTANIDLQSLWKAVGANYQNGSKDSWSYSLDKRVAAVECHTTQLAPDLYGNTRQTTGDYVDPNNAIEKYEGDLGVAGDPGWGGWTWSTSCAGTKTYGVAEYVQYLALLHGVSSTSGDKPWEAKHQAGGSTVTLPLTQEATDIRGSGAYIATRTDPFSDSLKYDLGRLRSEIQYLRGTSWSSGVQTGTFVTNWPSAGDMGQNFSYHIACVGRGTAGPLNPHGTSFHETGAEPLFAATRSFTGMSTETDSSPTYSAHFANLRHISDGDSLELAIAKVDQVTPTTISRYELLVSRPLLTEEERETTPIVVNHTLGQYPVVNIIDLDPETGSPYVSWTRDVSIEHIDVDTFYVYTGAEDAMIVWIG